MQEGDFKIFNTVSGFNIKVEGGQPKMTGGYTPAILISLFAEEFWYDTVSKSNVKNTGEFGKYIKRALNNSDSINEIPNIIQKDLKWMKDQGITNEIIIETEKAGPEKTFVAIRLIEPANLELKFVINWNQQKLELIGVD